MRVALTGCDYKSFCAKRSETESKPLLSRELLGRGTRGEPCVHLGQPGVECSPARQEAGTRASACWSKWSGAAWWDCICPS